MNTQNNISSLFILTGKHHYHDDDDDDDGDGDGVNVMHHLGQRCMSAIVSALQIQTSAA